MVQTKYKRVLLIDDNEVDNFVNQKIISSTDFAESIIVKQSGQAGLDYLKSCTEENHLPDIIFLDILMPVMDGFEFLEQFESLPDNIKNKCKVIMLSTSESFRDLNRANKNKFVFKFLNKPLSEAMISAINI
jgi:CheY-like chemotaxis protein